MKFCCVRTVPEPPQYEQVSAAVTARAALDAGIGDLPLTAERRFFKAQVDLDHDVLTLGRGIPARGCAAASAPEEVAENVAEIAETEAASAKAAEACARSRIEVRVNACEAVLVIARLLVGVRQDLICLVDLLELLLSGLVAGVLVGVVLHGELAVRLLDLCLGRIFLYAEHLIIISLVLICHLSLTSISVETAERGGRAAPDLLHVPCYLTSS